MRELLRRVWHVLRLGRQEADLAEEIEHHRHLKQQALERQGVSPADAAIEARRALGNVLIARERARDVWIWPWLQDAMQDLRFAGRLLLKDRWFTLGAATALALGIGANTTVFTILNAISLQNLPVEQPRRVVSLSMRDARGQPRGMSYLDFIDWRESARSFTGVAAFTDVSMSVSDEGRAPDRVTGTFITANGFDLLRVQPARGRGFVPEDDRPGAPRVAILGHRVWTTRYGGDASIVGRGVRVDGVAAVIVGIMPEGFRFPFDSDVWLPLAQRPGAAAEARDARGLAVFARLADGIGLPQARVELDTIAARLARQYPDTNKDLAPAVITFNERYNGRITDPIPMVLMGAVGFVLLIACANVANLLLARAARRSREICIRASLGATRWRIVRQVLVESVLLAMIAGALGFWLALAGVRVFTATIDELNLPFWVRFTFDARVFAFMAAVCLGTGVAFGLAPALHVSKTNLNDALRDGGRSGAGPRARRWTSLLLVSEIALTLVLLAGAAFLLRGSLALYRADLVVDPAKVLTMRLTLPQQRYRGPEQQIAFYERLQERLDAIEAIPTAALATALPFAGATRRELSIEGRSVAAGDRLPAVLTVGIGPGYFEALGLRLSRGRGFDGRDGAAGLEAAIVNERFASVHLPGEDPIGRRIRLIDRGTPGPWLTIVATAPTVRQRPFGEADPVVYVPHRALPGPFAALLLRAPSDPTAIASLLREEVRALDPDLPLYSVMPLSDLSEMSRWTHRVLSTMLGIFAVIAMTLSVTGLYGVTAHAVTERTQEIGVRMALGARAPQVLWLLARRMLTPLALGLAIGLVGALAAGRLLRSAFIDASGTDPLTLSAMAVSLAVVAVMATLLPARRASRLDPVAALRQE